MDRDQFDDALRFVLAREGGYSDHPADHGGPTNRGITQKTYDRWRLHNEYPQQSVKEITESEVRRVYREFYWEPSGCHLLPHPVSMVLFDGSVNLGVKQAIRLLQISTGHLEPEEIDGAWGPKTQRAVLAEDAVLFCQRLIEVRRQFYRDLVTRNPSQGIFLKGWMARCQLLEDLVNKKDTI